MKKLLNSLGFRKMDEMEKTIALKAQRVALFYVTVALLSWSFYESYKVYAYGEMLNSFPSMLLGSTSLVLVISQAFFKYQAVKGDEEFSYSGAVWKFVVIAMLVFGLIMMVGTFILVSGVLR